ncbi:LysE family transporter [Ciceribacter sp. L1K23]|nr:LysE family transporter [Ciceribacter sp. L1K23]
MTMLLFGKGLLLGLAIAAPVGPIGALCIQRTLQRGFLAGIAGGLGTALADGAYAAMAAAGFAALSGLLEVVSLPLQLAGGAFLLWFGVTSFRPRGEVKAAGTGARDLVSTTVATFFLTIANPATILSFAAIFAGLGLAGERTGPALLVAGVFCGSMLWWIFLSGLVRLLQHRLPPSFSTWVSWVSGGVLLGFGLLSVGLGLRTLLL